MPPNDPRAVLTELRTHAQAWEPDACLLGNLTAYEIAEAIRDVLGIGPPAPKPRERATMELQLASTANWMSNCIKVTCGDETLGYIAREDLARLAALDARVDADGYEVEAGQDHDAVRAAQERSHVTTGRLVREMQRSSPAPSSLEPRRWWIVMWDGMAFDESAPALDHARKLDENADGDIREVVESSALDAAQRELARLREAPRMTEEVVERAAVAIYHRKVVKSIAPPWSLATPATREECFDHARAALRALGYTDQEATNG